LSTTVCIIGWVIKFFLKLGSWYIYIVFIHGVALATRKMPEELKRYLMELLRLWILLKLGTTWIMTINSFYFTQKCAGCQVLSRLFELRNKVNTFFIQMASPLPIGKCLCDYSWLAILAYLADIFAYINVLNLSFARNPRNNLWCHRQNWGNDYKTISMATSFITTEFWCFWKFKNSW